VEQLLLNSNVAAEQEHVTTHVATAEREENNFLNLKYSIQSILKFDCNSTISHRLPPVELLESNAGLVDYYLNSPPFYDEPKLYGFATLLKKNKALTKYHKKFAREISIGFAGGASLSKDRALWKVIGESAERYSLFMYSRQSIKSTFEQLQQKGIQALNPNKVVSSTSKNPRKNKHTLKIDWVKGFDLVSRCDSFIPTQLIAVPYWDSGKERIWRAPITTGAAAGSSLQSAIFNGLCEVIERDAFMVCWLKQLRVKKIVGYIDLIKNLNDSQSVLFLKTISAVKRYNLIPEFYLLPNDTPLPTVMCVLRDNTKIGPPLTIGLDTDNSIIKTMLGALEESLQLRPWVRQIFEEQKLGNVRTKSNSNLYSLEERARLWTQQSSIFVLNDWLDRSTEIHFNEIVNTPQPLILKKLIEIIKKTGCSVYCIDLTKYLPSEVQKHKIFAAKVIIPEYQPLYLIERYADYVWDRLESSEERYLTISGLKKGELQKYPHPML